MTPVDDEQAFKEAVEDWMDGARADLEYAEIGARVPKLPGYLPCFHAQQAAEKALKAVLIHRRLDFPKTHDLADLTSVCAKAGVELQPFHVLLPALNPFAVMERYPGKRGVPPSQEVNKMIDLARQAVDWAENATA